MSDQKNYLEQELEALIQTDLTIWQFIRQASLDGVWYWDLENPENEYMSPEFWENFGYDPATKDHKAAEWQDLINPEDLETAKQNFAAHIEDPNHPYDQVVRYKRADGGTSWVRCRGVAVRDGEGRAIRLLGAHNDITELMEKGRESDATAKLLSKIMDTAQSGIIGLSHDKTVVSINPAGRHILGGVSTSVPFAWPDDIDFVDGESFAPLEASKNPVFRAVSGATLHGIVSVMNRRAQTEPRYVRISSAQVQDSDSPISCVIIIDDVSEQEKNRQQVERSSRLDALGQLTGGIAHDFNNMLATIQYALQLAEGAEGAEDAEKRQGYLSAAMRSIDTGSELTRRLLAFAKRQPGALNAHNVSSVLADFQKLAQPLIEANIDLSFEVESDDLWVHCNGGQLENAILNLLLNSRDAIMRSGKGSKITILVRGINEIDADVVLRREHSGSHIAKGLHAEHEADVSRRDGTALRYVEFAVTDDGPGMSAEIKRRAIDPFFTTKKTNSGTGLGLSMVYGFVQQSNGELRIYSEEGQGTTMRLLLPRGTPEGEREEPQERALQAQGTGQKILVVEDEQSLLELMEDLITSMSYSVVTAASAKDALAATDAHSDIALVLTDIVMPGGMGGFELARELRNRFPDLPILYMSGYTGFSEAEMNDVVAPMLQKPCQPSDLADAIKTALEG